MIQELLNLLGTVVANLRGRPDFISITFTVNHSAVTAAQAVERFNAYQQDLLTLQARGSPVPDGKSADILTLIAAIIDTNLAIAAMGPLNTRRSIEPEAARAYNKTLAALQDEVMRFRADGPGPDPDPDQYNPGMRVPWD